MNNTEQIADVLFAITKTIKSLTEKSLKEYGIGIGQLQVLLSFYSTPNEMFSQQELVNKLKVDKGNISRNIAKLVSKDYVILDEDTRKYELSQKGINLKSTVMKYFIDTHQIMIQGLSEQDLITTMNSLLVMSHNLEEV